MWGPLALVHGTCVLTSVPGIHVPLHPGNTPWGLLVWPCDNSHHAMYPTPRHSSFFLGAIYVCTQAAVTVTRCLISWLFTCLISELWGKGISG